MKLSDFKGIFKKSQLVHIKSENPHDDYHVFDFTINDNMKWNPGEHGIFTMPDKKITGKKWRAFSVTSIPEEGVLRIATRIGESPSSYKTALKKLKPEEKISIRGPFGWFKLQDETSPIVMVAGGIGITPIRALLKEIEKGNKRQVTFIYSAKGRHLFQKDIEEICEKDDNITIAFVGKREDVLRLLDEKLKNYGSSAFYYLSGIQSMNKDLKKIIKSRHIPGNRIIVDPFLGY